ncbi:MAG: hypothetical protein RBQ78_00695 [Acholeplasmataceae bacterium]|jgi:phi13 family phage major tail protein|nr:hypothetical protein [Acholeplasmataceae bacterium]
MSNKVTFGLKNVHYAVATPNEDDSWDFGTPKKLNGAQELSAEVIAGKTDVYADDKIIATLASSSGSNITLKLTELDDDFKVDVLGFAKDSNGNLVEVINHRTKTFALGYEIQGDAKSRRIWYFLCTASPISDNTKSKAESIEPNEVSIDITARSIEVGNYSVIRTIAKYGDTNYSSFFTQVPELPVIGV